MSTQSSSKRAASPIVYDKTKLKRASSHSASSSEGEVTDSDNEAPRQVQSTIKPVTATKTSRRSKSKEVSPRRSRRYQ